MTLNTPNNEAEYGRNHTLHAVLNNSVIKIGQSFAQNQCRNPAVRRRMKNKQKIDKLNTLLNTFVVPTCPVSSLHLCVNLLQLAGCTILGVGIWVKVDSGSIFHLFGQIENAPAELSQVLSVGYLLIALGSFLLIIGFLGSCGVIRESKCLLLLVSTHFLLNKVEGMGSICF